MMDPFAVTVGLGAFVILGVIVYLITVVSTREKTYEEVIAEQKKRQQEELEKTKNEKKIGKEQMKKKYKKGKGDKLKEKSAQVSEPDLKASQKTEQNDHKMVNLEIEPEYIEPEPSVEKQLKGNKKSKNRTDVRQRSILHNREEVTPVTQKAEELHHKPIKPLDDVELKKLHDAQVHEIPAKKEKRQQTELKQEVREPVKETKMQKAKVSQSENMAVPNRSAVEEKKATNLNKSKSATAVDERPLNASHLIESVRSAHLSDRDVQYLIDILLNRQGSSSASQESWNKKSQKGDPTIALKKQLEEREKALNEQQQQAQSSNKRIKELQSELAGERAKVSSAEKQIQENLSQQAAELDALQVRMRHAHEQHMAETAKYKAHIQQLENSGDAALVQKLKQENRILQDTLSKSAADNAAKGDVSGLKLKVTNLEKELSNSTNRLSASENAKKSSEEKLKASEEQLKKLEAAKKSSESSLAKSLGEMKEEKQKNGKLNDDLKKATGALSSAEAECANLKTKLQELEKHLSASDMNKELEAKLQESERKKQVMEGNMKNLEKQLSDAARGQSETGAVLKEHEQKRQELEGNLKNLEKQLADAAHLKSEVDVELHQLRQDKLALTQELQTTKEMKQKQAATNGDVHAKDRLSNVIQITEHERIVSEKVAELTKLQAELEAQQKSATRVAELQSELNTQKQKNNENVSQAVSDAEKTDKEVFKRLFPSINVGDKLIHKDWIASFEKQAAQHLAQLSGAEKSLSDKMSHLKDENSRLQADVEVFKNNIAILHSEKDRLHELQEENRKLQQQSETYEKNFTQLNAERESFQKIEEENKRLKSMASNTSSSEEVSKLQEEKKELQSQLVEKEENIAEAEKKLHNLEAVVETEEKKWKEKLRQAEEALNRDHDSSSREQELEDLTIQQQAQIEHYRTVLTSTENVLKQLESEEKSWEAKLQTSQEDFNKSRLECQRLQDELQSLRGSTEMQGKVENLEEELKQSSDKLNLLTKEKEELTSKVIVLETQTKAVVQVDNEDLKTQLDKVQAEVEKERKKNKDLSSTLVRLNGIIKTGQDALTQEQQLVRQLQEQLAEKVKGAGSNASQEIEQGNSAVNDAGTSV